MTSVLTCFRCFCKRTSPITLGQRNTKEMYTVTGSLPVIKTADYGLYNARNTGERAAQPTKRTIPLKIIRAGKLHIYLKGLQEADGDLTQGKLFSKPVVALHTLDAVKGLLERPETNARLSPFFEDYVLENKGFSFSDMTQRGAKQKAVLKKFLYYTARHSNTAVLSVLDDTIQGLVEQTDDVNPDVILRKFLSNTFTTLLIGETLPENDPDQGALWDLIDNLYTLLDPSIDAPLRMFPFLRFLPVKHGRIFRATIKARDKVSQRYLDTQKATYEEGRVRGLVDVCLKIQHEERMLKGESWLSDDYIKGLMYDTVAAGMSEMMKSIRMLILLMCHYQDVQSRVQTEIDDVIGVCATPASNHRQEMPFTHAVILEMLRYVSQTPLAIPHKCNKDVLLDGYLIEKNAGIFPNIWGIHHDEDVWGDPWVFRPERFLTENGQLLPKDHRHMKSLIPFSVGKRRCPGEDFAMSRLFLVLTAMLQKLTFEPPQQTELPSVDPRLYSNMYPLHLPVFSCRAVRRPRETQI